ncbi:MAG: DUF2842 domain-containing protein [Croceibacterium sp.]
MRDKPTLRIPLGILALLAILAVYAVAIAGASSAIGRWPVPVQAIVYLLLGTIWLLPLRRFLIWMETGRWR